MTSATTSGLVARADKSVDPMAAQPTGSLDVTVVLPCLNEEASVGLCVQEALQALAESGLHGEILVVDNGSTDRSVSVAIDAGARVVIERRAGYGNALRAGIHDAQGCVVVMADADCTYDLSRVADLARPVLNGDIDMMLGGRLDAATRATMPLLHRMIGTPVLTFLNARASGGLPVRDSQSGFRAFRRDSVVDLGLRTTGMEYASEMLIRAARQGWRIREIPTGYRPRVGESKLNTLEDGWRHLRLIFLLAPDLLLIWPGMVLVALGTASSAWGLVTGDKLALGSWHWQPVFFSSVATVLGIHAAFAGVILANRSSALGAAAKRRFSLVGNPHFPRRCIRTGTISFATGIALDLTLAFAGSQARTISNRGLVLAGIAQTLLIVGATAAGFGWISRLMLVDRRAPVGPPLNEDTERATGSGHDTDLGASAALVQT